MNNKEKPIKKFTWWISKSFSILGLIYLLVVIFVPSTVIKINKIDNTDIFLFAIMFLFNSGLIEKIEGFSIDGTKIETKFLKLEEKQDQQKEELDNLQQQQIDLQKKQLDILTVQQQEISQIQKEQNLALRFAVKAVITHYEFKHIRELRKCEEEGKPYIIDARYIKAFEQEITHLYAVRFITKKATLSQLMSNLRANRQEDLTQYVYVSAEGRGYLELREKLDIDEPDYDEAHIAINQE